jgi:glycosyltransferase involved in cell wall biosynthesis
VAISYSAVVPLCNEAESLAELHARLSKVLEELGKPYEILFVNDGSTDAGPAVLDALAAADRHVGVIHFRRNFGKAAALDAGFKRARGDIVLTLDADLQDAPEELPSFVATIEEGFDVVSGWKRQRRDPLSKRLPSRVFNAVVGHLFGLELHDFNCGLKAYRAEALEGLQLYGEMHRYIPVLLHSMGFRATEREVRHEPRRYGRSKYGLGRLAKGFFDLITVLMNTRYRSRPLHLFGLAGMGLGTLGVAILGYLTLLWFRGLRPIGNRPLLFLGLLLVMVGVQLVSTGLLGELMNRQLLRGEAYYVVRSFRPPLDAEQQRAQVSDAKPHRPLVS